MKTTAKTSLGPALKIRCSSKVIACWMIQSSCWAAIRVSDSGRESVTMQDMANLRGIKGEDAHPREGKPSGDDGNGNKGTAASATARAAAVRVEGCEANG